jgi:cell division septation protein DedD
MKFLLVLSDAFDALWAVRGRVALALAGIALVGVLVAVYLPMLSGGEPPSPPPVAARSPTVQGPVGQATVAPQAAAPAPAAAAAPPPSAPAAAQPPAPVVSAATAASSSPDRAPAPLRTSPAPEQAPEAAPAPRAAPEPRPAPAPAPAAEPVFRVQVGAFREVERATTLSRRLTRAGFPTSVLRGTTADGKTIYRVRTRQALPKGEARQLVARLRHRVPALRPILVPGGEATG